jgi:hypothetical protein
MPNESESKQLTFNLLMQSDRQELNSPQDDFRNFEFGAKEIQFAQTNQEANAFVEAALYKTTS